MRAKEMSSAIASDTEKITQLIENMGVEKLWEHRETHPRLGGHIEILFIVPRRAGFQSLIERKGLSDLFYRQKGDAGKGWIRFRTPRWGGVGVPNKKRHTQFLDTLKEIEERLEGG